MSGPRDYYRILHVHPDAPTEIIHASYRTLMQRLRNHPDLGGDHDNAVLINEAYAVLSDPVRRAAYDTSRPAQHAPDATRAQEASAGEIIESVAGVRCGFCGAPHRLERALAAEDECARCASPLFPAARQRLDYSGQRMLTRMPKELSAELFTAWGQERAHAAEVRDLSLNGMLIATRARLAPNRVVKVDCEICRTIARVAHCRRDPADSAGWLAGLEFMTLRFVKSRGGFVSTSV